MRVNVSLVAFVLSAPDAIEQVITRPGAARLRCQQLQNLKLERREIDFFAASRNFVAPLIYYQLPDLHPIFIAAVRLGDLTSAQERLDPVFEFAWAERLGKVIVSAGFETSDLIVEHIVRRQEQRGRFDAAVTQLS